MKNSVLIVFFCLLTGFIQAQMQDLANLASGTLVKSQILFDSQKNVYGYIYFFEQEKIDKETTKVEYVFLDKNLNKVSNCAFNVIKYKKTQSYFHCLNVDDEHLLLARDHFGEKDRKHLFSSFQIISLKNSTVSSEYCYEDGLIVSAPQNLKSLNKVIYRGSVSGVVNNKNKSGFFIKEYDGFNIQNKNIKFFNVNRELQWTYEYNPDGKKKNYKRISIGEITNDNIYLLETQIEKGEVHGYKIIALNAQTGEKKYDYVFENKKSVYSHTLDLKEINNQLILTGNYSGYSKADFQLDKNLGFYKIILDEEGKEIEKKYTSWDDFKDKIEIDRRGRVEKNYRLRPTRFFILDDGTICILTEKYKPAKEGIGSLVPIPFINAIVEVATIRKEKTTDFVLFFMNEDFTVNSVKTIQKDISKVENYDYLFSQYIKDGKGGVFFFKDFIKEDKNWILGVNVILNGELKEERIQISSKKDKYVIYPMPAKEGYIILREYNEKEKYNQIRLERLNY